MTLEKEAMRRALKQETLVDVWPVESSASLSKQSAGIESFGDYSCKHLMRPV